jgi:hypothetical protein
MRPESERERKARTMANEINQSYSVEDVVTYTFRGDNFRMSVMQTVLFICVSTSVISLFVRVARERGRDYLYAYSVH